MLAGVRTSATNGDSSAGARGFDRLDDSLPPQFRYSNIHKVTGLVLNERLRLPRHLLHRPAPPTSRAFDPLQALQKAQAAQGNPVAAREASIGKGLSPEVAEASGHNFLFPRIVHQHNLLNPLPAMALGISINALFSRAPK